MAQRGLSTTGRSNQGHRLSRFDGEIDIPQHLRMLAILKRHIVKLNLSHYILELNRIWAVNNSRGDFHHLHKSPKPSHSQLIPPSKVDHPPQGLHRKPDEHQIGRKVSYIYAAPNYIDGAGNQNGQIQKTDQKVHSGVIPSLCPIPHR